MKQKNSWQEIFETFKNIYPNLSQKAIYFRPHDYYNPKILVYMNDGTKWIYDDFKKRTLVYTGE